jgi:hypothetical protein
MSILGLALFAHISHIIKFCEAHNLFQWHTPLLIVKSHDRVMKVLLEENNKHIGNAEWNRRKKNTME